VKIVIKVLENLNEVKIPEGMFVDFVALRKDDKVLENSILQTSIGHVGYLMPTITKCISNNNFDVRKAVQLLIAKIATSIQK
jgi:hypothetical protein